MYPRSIQDGLKSDSSGSHISSRAISSSKCSFVIRNYLKCPSWIGAKFGSDIHSSHTMNPNDFDGPLTFPTRATMTCSTAMGWIATKSGLHIHACQDEWESLS